MNVSDIKRALKPLDCFLGCNLYPDEPTTLFHIVSIKRGMRGAAKRALEGAGAKVTVPIGSTIYAEYLNVYR